MAILSEPPLHFTHVPHLASPPYNHTKAHSPALPALPLSPLTHDGHTSPLTAIHLTSSILVTHAALTTEFDWITTTLNSNNKDTKLRKASDSTDMWMDRWFVNEMASTPLLLLLTTY